ncbi:MAG: hypothetical protein KKD77_22895 [Gammaproteobacteria bacterium]|nr:hypothetical protein [Gammaproteobacteria bacterium]
MGHILGMDERQAQQYIFTLGTVCVFALLLRNIWLTLFMWLSVLLFAYYKFECGQIYISNLFFGSVIYYLVKVAFKKEHIPFFINAFLWLIFINLGYMVCQLAKFDFIYKMSMSNCLGEQFYLDASEPVGFFGFRAMMAVVMAMAIPIFLSKRTKIGDLCALGMVIPLWLGKCSIAWAAAVIVSIFMLKNRLSRKAFIAATLGLVLLGTAYIVKVDAPMGMLPTRIHQWKMALTDARVHWVSGWGLDSFRTPTSWKPSVYAMNATINPDGSKYAAVWDNPHNLYVSLVYEWGILGILLLIGYMRQLVMSYGAARKDPETVALAGFLIVFFIVSLAQFPIFLARTAAFIIPAFALFEVACKREEE